MSQIFCEVNYRLMRLQVIAIFIPFLIVVGAPAHAKARSNVCSSSLVLSISQRDRERVQSKGDADLRKTKDPREAEDLKATWKGVYQSDPKYHNPGHYRYLIRTIGNRLFADRLIEQIGDISSRDPLSLSLVDQDNTLSFWGTPMGVIVRVPPENILATYCADIGNVDSSLVLKQFGLSTPDKLIKDSLAFRQSLKEKYGQDSWNEVRVRGTVLTSSKSGRPVESKISVSGLFYFDSLSRDKIRRLRILGERLDLPLIKLENKFKEPSATDMEAWRTEYLQAP